MKTALQSTYALLFAERVTDGGVHAPVVDGVDPAYGVRLTCAAEQRMLPCWLRGLQSGSVMDRATLQRDHDFTRSAFFDYVVRPEGKFHCLITTPYVTPLQRFYLIIGRSYSRDDYSGEDIRLVHALLPHVGRLIASGMALRQSRSDAVVLASALDRLPTDIVLVSADRQVAFANKGARRHLNGADGLSVAGGKLTTADPATTLAIEGAITRALRAPDGSATAPIGVRRLSGRSPWQLTVEKLSEAAEPLGQLAGDPPLAMVVIRQSAEPAATKQPGLSRSYGLTCKERDLVGLLAQGSDLRCAAAALGMGYNTARYHLRHIFTKTDTHRQSELMRLVFGTTAQLHG